MAPLSYPSFNVPLVSCQHFETELWGEESLIFLENQFSGNVYAEDCSTKIVSKT